MSEYAKLMPVMERPDDISALIEKDLDASIESLGERLLFELTEAVADAGPLRVGLGL